MSEVIKKYTNGEVTIVWQPSSCTHSAICISGMPTVFDTQKRPWVNLQGAETAHIIQQVKSCPSGALSYFMNSAKNQATEDPLVRRV